MRIVCRRLGTDHRYPVRRRSPRRHAPTRRHGRRARCHPDRARPAAARSPRTRPPCRARGSTPHACTPTTDPMRYATALAEWGDAGGYDAEVLWDECTSRALDADFRHVADRPLRRSAEVSRSGSRSKRSSAARTTCSCSTNPTTSSTSTPSAGSKRELLASRKTVLFVSHDRELLAATASKIVTVEAEGTWTHGAGFATYAEARAGRTTNASNTIVGVRRRAQATRGAGRRDAPPGQGQRHLRTEAQGGREPAAPVRREERATDASAARRRSTSGCAAPAPANAPSSSRASNCLGLTDPFDLEVLVRRAGRGARAATESARAISSGCSPATQRSSTKAVCASALAS